MRTQRHAPPVFLLLVAAIGSAPAVAEYYIVDRTDDLFSADACTPAANDCSLRGAVGNANDHAGPDWIQFGDLGVYRIVSLQGPDLNVFDDLTIDGGYDQGVAVVGSPFGGRVFNVTHAELWLRNLLVTGAEMEDGYGGGILASDAELTLERVEVSGNYAESGGGGIAAVDSDVVLWMSTVAGNETSWSGGGIHAVGDQISSLILDRSTVSGNLAWGGNALAVYGGNVDLTYSTIADNVGSLPADPDILLDSWGGFPSWVFRGTIVKGDCDLVGGTITSGGVNVESPGDSCGLSADSDQVGILDAGLSSLDDFGGATIARVHRPMVLGPAVDLPFPVVPSCAPYDQRGMPRPLDGDGDGQVRCDAGAVELQPLEVVFWDDFETGDTSRWSGGVP